MTLINALALGLIPPFVVLFIAAVAYTVEALRDWAGMRRW